MQCKLYDGDRVLSYSSMLQGSCRQDVDQSAGSVEHTPDLIAQSRCTSCDRGINGHSFQGGHDVCPR